MLPKFRESAVNTCAGSSVVDDSAGDGIGKELQDPADDHAVTDGDSEGTDDRNQTDDSAKL